MCLQRRGPRGGAAAEVDVERFELAPTGVRRRERAPINKQRSNVFV